jgi:hypothetical protein
MFRRPIEFLKMFLGARRKAAFLLQTNASFRLFERLGIHVTPIHFYSPVPDLRDLEARPELWQQRSTMTGVDMNEQSQLMLMHKVVAPYRHECAYSSRATDCPHEYHTDNVYFGRDSASVMHSMIRHHRPRKIIEVGAGYSTYAIANACRMNAAAGAPVELIAIDPYPNPTLRAGFPGLTRLISKRIEDVELDFLTNLQANDILSIDTSHAVKTGGDVNFLYLEVLPRLAPGVQIHIHDIFFPEEYPKEWLERRTFWTEQYLLQAFLIYNRCFEVVWAQRFMELRHAADYKTVFVPGSGDPVNHGSYSFWMRRT